MGVPPCMEEKLFRYWIRSMGICEYCENGYLFKKLKSALLFNVVVWGRDLFRGGPNRWRANGRTPASGRNALQLLVPTAWAFVSNPK